MKTLLKNQKVTFTKKNVKVNGELYRKVIATVRFDDQCGNGHHTLGVTGDAWYHDDFRRDPSTCGCIHDILLVAFPELKNVIDMHLMSTEAPMHYVANTMYHVRTTTHEGKKVGEPVKFKKKVLIGNSKWPHEFNSSFIKFLEDSKELGQKLKVISLDHHENKNGGYQFKPKYTFEGFANEWHECPFDSKEEAFSFINTRKNAKNYHNYNIVSVPTEFCKAVKPDIEAARSCAIWPEATLEQLQNKELLESRIPELQERLKKAVTALGLEY